MLRTVVSAVRDQWMGALALFLVLAGGTAYAANTIGSSDVIDESLLSQDVKNGEVKVADIGQGAVATDEIANGQVKTADIGDGEVRSSDVFNDSLSGNDIAGNSLKGADIDESTLTNIGGGGPAGGDLTGTYPNPQIKADAVGGGEIVDDSLDGGLEIFNGTLSGADIAENSLSRSDIANEAIGSGELGVGAVPGHMYTKQASTAVNTTNEKELTVSCNFPDTDRIVSGGYVIAASNGASVPYVIPTRSYAIDNDSWLVRANAFLNSPSYELTVIITCVY